MADDTRLRRIPAFRGSTVMPTPTGIMNRRRSLAPGRPGRPLASKVAELQSSEIRWSLFMTGCFLILGMIGILQHEMWRDEYQAWMIAHDSAGMGDLIRISRFDGHPVLWFTVLFLLSRLTSSPLSMQILHLSIAAASIFIINRFSPFRRLPKFLFSFGYFPFYEYALISREYALGILCTAIFCALYGRRRERYLQISFVLFLLSNTSVYGMLLALSFAACLIMDFFVSAREMSHGPFDRIRLFFSLLIVIAGPVCLFYQLRPGEVHYFPLKWATAFEWHRFKIVLTFLLRTYFPVPDLSIVNFWNSHILLSGFSDSKPILSLSIFLASATLFIRKPLVLILYSGGTVAMLVFSYMSGLPWLRHTGQLYILFFACLWIENLYAARNLPSPVHRMAAVPSLRAASTAYLAAILAANLFAGIYAFQMDVRHPFSNSRAAARYIRDRGLDRFAVVGSTDYIVSPLSTLLHRKILYPERGTEGSFILWDDQRRDISSLGDIVSTLVTVLRRGNEKVLLVLDSETSSAEVNKELLLKTGKLEPGILITLEETFGDPCIVGDETYYIYTAQKQVRH